MTHSGVNANIKQRFAHTREALFLIGDSGDRGGDKGEGSDQ